jgi:intracellular septation protein
MSQETAKKDAEKHDDINWAEMRPQLTKLALELGPLVVFFIGNAKGEDLLKAYPGLTNWFSQPIIFATALFMAAMVVSLLLSWLILKRVAVMPLVTGVVVLIFGGLTLWLQDDTFIKMKPTITNALFGSVLLGGLLFGQSLLKYVFGDVYKLDPKGWFILTVRWGIFFFALAIANEVLWRNFSTDVWVAFKVWGIMPITVIFSMFQLPILSKYAPAPAAEPTPVPPLISDL